jgi:polyisoprenoid-binding protein YceI
MRLYSTLFILSIGLLTIEPAWAAWKLDNEHSVVSFISIKNSDIAEVHHFNKVAGIVEGDNAQLTIDLATVDTNIAIRDQRMRDYLFEVDQPAFAQAQFKTTLPAGTLSAINVGEFKTLAVDGEINLHGENQTVNLKVLVAKLTDKKMVISSLKPIIIQADQFALVDGIAKLQALAGLPSISNAVPVSFVLVFEQH